MSSQARRRTRFVCVSDTHAYAPSEAGFPLPTGDVLIHAGDLTNQGSMSELRKTIDWISKADFEVKIIVGGNHDITLDSKFYAEHGSSFHNQNLEYPEKCMEVVMNSSPSIVYLNHQSALIRLVRPDGPCTIFKVFGSPHSQFGGNWAFGYEDADAPALWNQIPLDTDILVTHTPPHSHCDSRTTGGPVGCKALRQAMSNVRPMLAICGHVHESRGYERIRWRLPSSSSREDMGEDIAVRGTLPPQGSKKQSLVDLTGKKAQRLENDGFINHGVMESSTDQVSARRQNQQAVQQDPDGHDIRSRRRETCVVNAAIMATSWPHLGGKKFNTTIIVDLELPVWT